MEMETNRILESLEESAARLSAAAAQLEKAAGWMEARSADGVEKIVAAVEPGAAQAARVEALEEKLREAERQIATLRAQAAPAGAARQTLPATAVQMLAKQGVHSLEAIEAGTLDAALAGLSLEQRIAVKSQLMRAGALV